MPHETETELRRINEQFAAEENAGNRSFFENRLAPIFAFRRANGSLDSRGMFLLSLKEGGKRTCDPTSIEINSLGQSRSVVNCVVEVEGRAFHNTRLFVKDDQGRWKLLAWANEEQ